MFWLNLFLRFVLQTITKLAINIFLIIRFYTILIFWQLYFSLVCCFLIGLFYCPAKDGAR